ncbi:hypothetical protein LMH87_001958 [Akanthomyces muscarius]|uniref:Uncharacterized protein n=1 Tax=Akanthomyces muscarius TaxID=2231603 RepID=A0A9W8Q7E1_AKAMU|nr:hypothetical protein LMH87_001958 [Akanthomyces muscarius]KAJ4147440.1 hypothetical protein LMH87_001958 [Akanthomyces muscarius]
MQQGKQKFVNLTSTSQQRRVQLLYPTTQCQHAPRLRNLQFSSRIIRQNINVPNDIKQCQALNSNDSNRH